MFCRNFINPANAVAFMEQQEAYAKQLQQLLKTHASKSSYLQSLDIVVGKSIHENVVKTMKERKFGKKVLFCTGNRAMRNHGFLEIYLSLFQQYGFSVNHYDNISSNPTLKQMQESIKVANEFKSDFIFALGGGSVIDTGKVIACGIDGGDVWDFVEKKKEIKKAIPIVASATTSGTGSHVTSYTVITNTDTLEKKTLKHDSLLPKMSVTDIDIIKYMPDSVVATTGFDVLCHAIEVFTRNDCTPVAEEFCINALKQIREHLVASYNRDSLVNKMGMVYADIYAGIALTLIGTHVPHAISHPISGRFPNINHGTALAYILPESSRKLIEKGNTELNQKFREISAILGGSPDFVRTIKNYLKLLDLPNGNRFSDEDCEKIYLDTIGYRRGSVERSPVNLSEIDIKDIIYTSLRKK